MKPLQFSAFVLVLVSLFCLMGCGNSGSQDQPHSKRSLQENEDLELLNAENDLGIQRPGKLAASVEAWAKSNDLGDYFEQSRDRLARLHALLIEDYKVRKESELEPTDYTHETLRKYREVFEVDETLRKFMVECYSRKEVRPLPQSISRWFKTPDEIRQEIRESIRRAPAETRSLQNEMAKIKAELAETGTSTWQQERETRAWRDLQIRMSEISSWASTARTRASTLAANMAKADQAGDEFGDVQALRSSAEQLNSDLSSLANHASKQLEIINGQMLVTEFFANCKTMQDAFASVPLALEKKTRRQTSIKEVTNLINSSRSRGYADLNMLAQQAAELKSRSQSELEPEAELGDRVQMAARNYDRLFSSPGISKLKKAVPNAPLQARIENELQSIMRAANLSPGGNLSGAFWNIKAKAQKLSDRKGEASLLTRMNNALQSAQRRAYNQR